MLGLTVIEGLRQHEDAWEDGTILDPDNDKTLQVRGYLGPFFRTQLWAGSNELTAAAILPRAAQPRSGAYRSVPRP